MVPTGNLRRYKKAVAMCNRDSFAFGECNFFLFDKNHFADLVKVAGN
jgi:hypothetical protein